MLRFSLASSLRLFAGGHRGVVTPVPIPNTEVKGSFAEGSAGLARARVGRRRLFYFSELGALSDSVTCMGETPGFAGLYFCDAARSAMGTEDSGSRRAQAQ